MKLIKNSICLLIFSLLALSCVQQKPLLVNDPYDPGPVEEIVRKGVKTGDYITLKVHNHTFYNLEVVEIDGPFIRVKQYLSNRNTFQLYDIYLIYIQELTVVDPEMTYPVGGPVTALLILFYLLV